MRRKYSDEDLIKYCKESCSFNQLMKKLGLTGGGGIRSIKNNIERLNIDISHFLGLSINKGKCNGPKRPLQDYLDNKVGINSHNLKMRLVREGIKEYKCENCGIHEWLGARIGLHLDHINGNHNDNSLTNLRILCPNCHSQTSTHGVKNIKK
jgi:5-methylcytosine-specific restriction endonuclease McrA